MSRIVPVTPPPPTTGPSHHRPLPPRGQLAALIVAFRASALSVYPLRYLFFFCVNHMPPPPATHSTRPHPLHPTPPDPTRVFNSSSSLLLGQPSLLKHFHPAALFYFCPATVKTAGGSSQVTLFADPARGGEWWWAVVVGSGGGGRWWWGVVGLKWGHRLRDSFFFFGLLWAKEAAFFLFFPLCGLLQRRENKAEEREGNKRDRRGGIPLVGLSLLWVRCHWMMMSSPLQTQPLQKLSADGRRGNKFGTKEKGHEFKGPPLRPALRSLTTRCYQISHCGPLKQACRI